MNRFEVIVLILKLLNDIWLFLNEPEGLRALVAPGVEADEVLVDSVEHLRLMRQLLLDRATAKDVLEVAPLTLNLIPLVKGLRERVELPLEVLSFLTHHFHESITQDHVDRSETLIKVLVHILDA